MVAIENRKPESLFPWKCPKRCIRDVGLKRPPTLTHQDELILLQFMSFFATLCLHHGVMVTVLEKHASDNTVHGTDSSSSCSRASPALELTWCFAITVPLKGSASFNNTLS